MMDNIMNELGITDFLLYEEIPSCRICNLDKDKILVICLIDELAQIDDIAKKIPSLRNKIMMQMNNPKNIEVVETKIPISKFLWDMYIVALHQYKDEKNSFKPVEIAKYERDRFIARKIIIQFEHMEELKRKFVELLYPEQILDSFSFLENPESEEIDFEEIKVLLQNIEKVVNKGE
ncbi:hypothetical protein [Paenibacillus sp. NRS-1781]|uniref:hypothetical protein n=1 Tax=Paenibacillus sp. NRS-1781 TaxID=3233905 RepID=UPI003D2E1E20